MTCPDNASEAELEARSRFVDRKDPSEPNSEKLFVSRRALVIIPPASYLPAISLCVKTRALKQARGGRIVARTLGEGKVTVTAGRGTCRAAGEVSEDERRWGLDSWCYVSVHR